jgi:hypothetical protein
LRLSTWSSARRESVPGGRGKERREDHGRGQQRP